MGARVSLEFSIMKVFFLLAVVFFALVALASAEAEHSETYGLGESSRALRNVHKPHPRLGDHRCLKEHRYCTKNEHCCSGRCQPGSRKCLPNIERTHHTFAHTY